MGSQASHPRDSQTRGERQGPSRPLHKELRVGFLSQSFLGCGPAWNFHAEGSQGGTGSFSALAGVPHSKAPGPGRSTESSQLVQTGFHPPTRSGRGDQDGGGEQKKRKAPVLCGA